MATQPQKFIRKVIYEVMKMGDALTTLAVIVICVAAILLGRHFWNRRPKFPKKKVKILVDPDVETLHQHVNLPPKG